MTRGAGIRVALLLSLICLMSTNAFTAVNAMSTTTLASQCSQISMMPGEVYVTYAKDMRPEDLSTLSPGGIDYPEQGLVDIHSFN